MLRAHPSGVSDDVAGIEKRPKLDLSRYRPTGLSSGFTSLRPKTGTETDRLFLFLFLFLFLETKWKSYVTFAGNGQRSHISGRRPPPVADRHRRALGTGRA